MNNTWVLYSNLQAKGYVKTKTGLTKDGQMSYVNTEWTQKGRIFIYELLKNDGFLPVVELAGCYKSE